MRFHLRRFWHDRRAATAVEYGLILAFVVTAVVAGLTALRDGNGTLWNGIVANVAAHGGQG